MKTWFQHLCFAGRKKLAASTWLLQFTNVCWCIVLKREWLYTNRIAQKSIHTEILSVWKVQSCNSCKIALVCTVSPLSLLTSVDTNKIHAQAKTCRNIVNLPWITPWGTRGKFNRAVYRNKELVSTCVLHRNRDIPLKILWQVYDHIKSYASISQHLNPLKFKNYIYRSLCKIKSKW